MFEQDIVGATTHIADVFRFAAKGGLLKGDVPVASLDRIKGLLCADSGVVSWQLSGCIDVEGKPRLDLTVNGQLMLRCQRCLNEMGWTLAVNTALLPVRPGQRLPEDELENDEADAIEVGTGGFLDVLSLVEDEIILALPIAPRHTDCRLPGSEETSGDERKKSPFAVLVRNKENS
ncbi:MAG: YceD family protein [Azoarcus sp.]|jgi:uncharacterized protein|nr:YceD family protein [Azoarcus sp.]